MSTSDKMSTKGEMSQFEDAPGHASRTSTEPTYAEVTALKFPNKWARVRLILSFRIIVNLSLIWRHIFRHYLREPAAEFLGVMILIIFGNGVDCQVVLSSVTAVAPSQKGVCSRSLL